MIRVEKLNKTYDRYRPNANHVLKDVSFTLPETGFVCILGPSGCGKTSLLNAIGGLDRFDNGTLATESVSVSRYGSRKYEEERNRNFGYIFQNYYLLPEHTVAYNIYLGLHSLKLSHREKLKRIRQALEAVDMSRYIRRKVSDLSGGQQQRVAIARALARRPRVIFADEPTGNLDEANTMNICSLLRQISRTSLVVMVTHEERIAKFFADRIIRLDSGSISQDSEGWTREDMALGSDKEIYAGDYEGTEFGTEDGVTLRLLQEEGAAPVAVTVVALKDRVIIKLADNRAVTCSAPEELPVLKEGKRPVLTLESMDREEPIHTEITGGTGAERTRAGQGLSFAMMLREAKALIRGGKARKLGMRIFLFLLAALTIWTVCDYLTVTSVDPKDFITTDSHIIEINLSRGPNAGGAYPILDDLYWAYTGYLMDSGLEFDMIPQPITSVVYNVKLFPQMEDVTATIKEFNYIPIRNLDPETLIYGTMPQNSGEIVVDAWVLEKVISSDSIIKNAVKDVSLFIGEELYFERCNVYMTIVGISDSGEPAMYMRDSDLLRTQVMLSSVMTLSDFKAAHPGEYDDLQIPEGSCVINISAAGSSYRDLIGEKYRYDSDAEFVIQDVVAAPDPYKVIVNDADMTLISRALCGSRFFLYCADKQAVMKFLNQPITGDLEGMFSTEFIDDYSEDMAEYLEASQVRIDARTIVTITVMLISMVMLYLLCRSQAQERIGMMAVYRLLGIPRGKLAGIFAMESVMASVQTALPASAAVFAVITVLTSVEDWNIRLVLPWQAAVLAYLGILAYHLIVALLPLWRLLRLPPAQLAAKYDY